MTKNYFAERLREYRDGLAGREATPEDTGILIGYQALASGNYQHANACYSQKKNGTPRWPLGLE